MTNAANVESEFYVEKARQFYKHFMPDLSPKMFEMLTDNFKSYICINNNINRVERYDQDKPYSSLDSNS